MRSCTCDRHFSFCRRLHTRAVSATSSAAREAAQEELIKKFTPLGYYIARRHFPRANQQKLDEVFQEIVVAWLEQLHAWPGTFQLCVFVALSASRRTVAFKRWEKKWSGPPLPENQPDKRTHRDEATRICFEEKIAEFPTDYQDLLKLLLSDLSMGDIARQLQKDRRTIYNWRKEMFEQLLECIGNDR